MTISRELLDELLSGVENANDLLGDKGLMGVAAQVSCNSERALPMLEVKRSTRTRDARVRSFC
jgi:hypothetical protein